MCLDAGHGGHQDDASGDVRIDHDPGCGLRGKETPAQIHAHQSIKCFGSIGQEFAVIRDASIGDHNIQSSRCVNEALKHATNRFHIGDVTRIRVNSFNFQGTIDLLRRSLAERRIEIVQRYRGPCAGESLAQRIANPYSSSGDENGFSRKSAHVFPPQSDSPTSFFSLSLPSRNCNFIRSRAVLT